MLFIGELEQIVEVVQGRVKRTKALVIRHLLAGATLHRHEVVDSTSTIAYSLLSKNHN